MADDLASFLETGGESALPLPLPLPEAACGGSEAPPGCEDPSANGAAPKAAPKKGGRKPAAKKPAAKKPAAKKPAAKKPANKPAARKPAAKKADAAAKRKRDGKGGAPLAKRSRTDEDSNTEEEPVPVEHVTYGAANQFPYIIHKAGSTVVAASPMVPPPDGNVYREGPGGLHDCLAVLEKAHLIGSVVEDSWHPLVHTLHPELCREPPRGAAQIQIADVPHAFQRFRKRQIDTLRMACNVWYCPEGDTATPDLDLQLHPDVRLHEHQEAALSQVFRHGYIGSGCVVLPCGSGKTLVGITAAARLGKSTMIVCNSETSAAQWLAALRKFCDSVDTRCSVSIFALGTKIAPKANLVLTTYGILGTDRGQAGASNLGRLTIESKRWGLIVLDEVHCVPTHTFTKALSRIEGRAVLGLTATPLREDDKVGNLKYLISPVTHHEELQWGTLASRGFLAKVVCVQVRCPFEGTFAEAYADKSVPARQKAMLAMLNPGKMRCCEALVRFHEEQGDKVLVFADSLAVLDSIAGILQRPTICGRTDPDTRIAILNAFRASSSGSTIVFSRVGDSSIDLPEANVLVQISAHFGSRCQETQRFGRISRPKTPAAPPGEADAYFYTLLTDGSEEMTYGVHRRKFLVQKGYEFLSVKGGDVVEHHLLTHGPDSLSLGTQAEIDELKKRV